MVKLSIQFYIAVVSHHKLRLLDLLSQIKGLIKKLNILEKNNNFETLKQNYKIRKKYLYQLVHTASCNYEYTIMYVIQ